MSSQGSLKTALSGSFARVDLKSYAAELPLGSLTVGVDNIHHDVYLSPAWTEQTRVYLLEFIRQTAKLTYSVQPGAQASEGAGDRGLEAPDAGIAAGVPHPRQIREENRAGPAVPRRADEIPDPGDRRAVRQPAAGSQGVDSQPRRVFRALRAGPRHEGAARGIAGQPAQHLSPGGPAHLPDPG